MAKKASPSEATGVPRVAWKPSNYAKAIDRSRQWLYTLDKDLQPKSIKVGYNVLIIEPPARFLKRLAQAYAKKAA